MPGGNEESAHGRLVRMVVENEGLRLRPYRCPAGKLTVGVGRNLDDVGISVDEAFYILENDLAGCRQDLEHIFSDFRRFSGPRQNALIDMRFNLGPGGFREFRKMISAIKAGDWALAAKEALDSAWGRGQVAIGRSSRDAKMLEQGEWV